MSTIRLLLVDDHPVVRQGIYSLLSAFDDIDIVAEADSLQSTVQQLEKVLPDIVLLDLRLGKESGLNVARYIKGQKLACRVVVLTTYDDEDDIFEALEAGVFAYLLKDISLSELPQIIRLVHSGKRYLSPDLMDQVLYEIQHRLTNRHGFTKDFSDAECALLISIADGLTNREIAQQLNFSEVTVKKRVQDLLIKMNVTNRTQAVALAIRQSLI